MTTVRRKRAASKQSPAKKPKPTLLYPGDTIEIGLTAQAEGRNGTFWPKAGGVTTIREGETESEARDRLGKFVEDTLAEMIEGVS